MRRRLGTLVLVGAVLLGGCGDEEPSGEADDEPRGRIGFTLVEMISETAVGGMVSPGGVALSDESAVLQFSGQFEDDRMQVRLSQEFADLVVPEDQAAYAAVVDIGCTPPPDVVVTSTDTGILIEGTKSTEKPVECFAPVTTVAIVLVDESVVG
jgi:hypothetical protein